MNINTTFLLSLLASTLFHISLVSSIQYLHFSSVQIPIKSGDVSREIDIVIELTEPEQSSEENPKIAKQANNTNKNKMIPKPKLKPEPEPRKETVKPSPLVKKEVNQNTQMEKKKKSALLPDEEKVSELVREEIINKDDLELKAVTDPEEKHYAMNPDETKQNVAIPHAKKVDNNIDNTSSVENGITTNTKPEYIKNPPPVYPRRARRLSYTGKVTLKVEVKDDGSCGHIEIIRTSGYSMLDKAATNAVKEWKFVPAKKWGKAVSSFTEIVINFQLK